MQELLRQSARASLAGEVLRRTGRIAIRVYGTSMLPTLWPGDVVFFETCDCARFMDGDVLLVCSNDRLIVHRVRQICARDGKLEFVTQGDSQCGGDPPIIAEQVLGRAVLLQRGASTPREISRHRSKLNVTFSWIAARSTLVCEVALFIHAASAKVRSYLSSTPGRRTTVAEVRS